ncbi:hypothetical protein BJF78_08070 [Pseudonocardia sp. CNS-139]|nr:hypothetical protein BJF78_08070 [Pseudonocardia sp. CNS-139]
MAPTVSSATRPCGSYVRATVTSNGPCVRSATGRPASYVTVVRAPGPVASARCPPAYASCHGPAPESTATARPAGSRVIVCAPSGQVTPVSRPAGS